MSTVATPVELRQFGIALETTRGTVAAAPTRFLSALKDSNLDFATKLLKDPALRGYNAAFPSFAGAQEAKGPFKSPARASSLNELLKMALGAPTTTEPQVGAWQHVYTQGQPNPPQLPSYTFFINRQFADASGNKVKAYNLGSLTKLKFSGKDDSPVEVEASLMAQQEATYAGAWTPVYAESPALMFSQTVVKVAGAAAAVPNVKEWSVEIDPGVKPFRPLSSAQYPSDFLAAGPYMVKGDMTIYFMTEAERNKFITDTMTSLEFITTGGAVGATVANYTLDLLMPNVEYDAYPFGDEDGFLGAKVKWNAPGQITAGAYVPIITATVINANAPGSF